MSDCTSFGIGFADVLIDLREVGEDIRLRESGACRPHHLQPLLHLGDAPLDAPLLGAEQAAPKCAMRRPELEPLRGRQGEGRLSHLLRGLECAAPLMEVCHKLLTQQLPGAGMAKTRDFYQNVTEFLRSFYSTFMTSLLVSVTLHMKISPGPHCPV